MEFIWNKFLNSQNISESGKVSIILLGLNLNHKTATSTGCNGRKTDINETTERPEINPNKMIAFKARKISNWYGENMT